MCPKSSKYLSPRTTVPGTPTFGHKINGSGFGKIYQGIQLEWPFLTPSGVRVLSLSVNLGVFFIVDEKYHYVNFSIKRSGADGS